MRERTRTVRRRSDPSRPTSLSPGQVGERALRGAFEEGEIVNQAGESAGRSQCLAGADDLLTGASASIDGFSSTSRAEAFFTVQIAACAVEKRLPAVALRPVRMPPRIGIVAVVIGVAGDVHAPRLTVVVDPG
jgi:hypothetical protein